MAPFGYRAARLALAAGADRRATLPVRTDTVERLGDQPCGRGLADPAHPGHQEGMRQPIAVEMVIQEINHYADKSDKVAIEGAVREMLRMEEAKKRYLGGRG